MELNIELRLIFAILNGKVSAAINRRLQQDFTAGGVQLTPEEWTILLYISTSDGVTQQQLCHATYRAKPAMSRLLADMEQRGLICREPVANNRRANCVTLTPKGKKIRSKAEKVAGLTLRKALRGLGRDELSISQDVLRKVFENTTQGTSA